MAKQIIVAVRTVFIAMCVVIFVSSMSHAATTRLKDILAFEGIRDNILVGYGLVVGLNGTGDKLQNNAFTQQSLIAFLERQGVNTRGTNLKTKNVAAVTVTATLPPFSRTGSRIDVALSTLGDAKSLLGGMLLATPMLGADGEVYAVAQGAVTAGGFSAGGDDGSSVTKGVPTSGFVSNGAIVEREIEFALNKMGSIKLALRNPDLTTATNVAEIINARIGPDAAEVMDPGTVTLSVPPTYENNVAYLLADIEQLQVDTDQVARVVVDEASGTVVMGENVRIDKVAVAQGNLIVRVDEDPQVSQPGPFAPEGAETVVVPQTEITIDENSDARLSMLTTGTSLRDMVMGLNALGVGPRDLITILQTIKAAGALQAEIEVR